MKPAIAKTGAYVKCGAIHAVATRLLFIENQLLLALAHGALEGLRHG
jgi:hypothetical protein